MCRACRLSLFGLVVSASLFQLLPAAEKGDCCSPKDSDAKVTWHTDYGHAMKLAERQGKMLLVFFSCAKNDSQCRRLARETLDAPQVRRKLQDYVCVRVSLKEKIVTGGKEMVLLKHPAYAEMLGKPGVAIVDFASKDKKLNGSVVSTFPITGKLWYTPERMMVILDLPPGTLTQRTLVYAVRIHPENPASTEGEIDPKLVDEARSHSEHQARIRLQGHHQWNSRFRRINTKLPSDLSACEVCAESWPGESLVEAAVECVRSWRHSSGHWSAVRARHRVWGYDMKRGHNGVWYATGIFGRKG